MEVILNMCVLVASRAKKQGDLLTFLVDRGYVSKSEYEKGCNRRLGDQGHSWKKILSSIVRECGVHQWYPDIEALCAVNADIWC